MNERRKSEGELLESLFFDTRSTAQKLLDRCKEIERRKKMKVIRISNYTWYILPQGKDIETWRKKHLV